MSQQQVTTGIVLARTNYGEADRIITVLTPDHGKLRLMAKGVRRVKSKLAGGVELFSVSSLTYIVGRGEIGTLISSRLEHHYGNIVKNIDRTMLGYELIRQLNKATEDETEADYFHILEHVFKALDDFDIPPGLIELWFAAHILKLSGHELNLQTDTNGDKLTAERQYEFSFDDNGFYSRDGAAFGVDQIKFLRLCFGNVSPKGLSQVQGTAQLAATCAPLVKSLLREHVRI